MPHDVTADGALAGPVDVRRAFKSKTWAAGAAISTLLVALVVAFPLGVGGDYVNHLARTYIESRIHVSEALSRYYEVAYGFIPDLSMDLTVPWLSHLIGIYSAGAVMVALSILVAPLAGVWLSARLHGARAGWLPLVGFASVFSLDFEFGFINFLFSTGLSLAAFTLWTAAAPNWRRVLIFAPASLVIVANHALAFLLFGYLALLWEIASFMEKERGDLRVFLTGLATRDAMTFLPGLVFLCFSVFGASDLEASGGGFSAPWTVWPLVILSPFLFHINPTSIAIAGLCVAAVGAGLYLGFRSRTLQIDSRMAVVCCGLAALIFLIPERVLGIWGLHFRYPPMLVILLAASVRFTPGAAKIAGKAAGVFALLFAMQFFNGAAQMHRINAAASDVRAALSSLPKRARVLPVIDTSADARIAHHTPGLAVIEADAFIPSLFTQTSPVGVAPAMRDLHMPAGLVTEEMLTDGEGEVLPPSENGYWSKRYYFGWPQHFTHVLYMRALGAPGLSSERLCRANAGPDFVLYRVKQGPNEPCPREGGSAAGPD